MSLARSAAPLALAALLCGALPACDDAAGAAPDAGVDATDATDDDVAPAPAFCGGPTTQRYDPVAGAELELFPDDFYTRVDDASPTGLRLDFTPAVAPWIADVAPLLRETFDGLDGLSGFGTNAGLVLRFDGPVGSLPATAAESLVSDAILLLDLSTDPPTRVPFEARTNDGGKDIILWPLRPLARATAHAAIITTAQPAADGGCLAPSETLRGLLTGAVSAPRLRALVPRYAALLAATGLEPAEVSAATVFTTQDDVAVIRAVAADVQARSYGWSEPPTCVIDGDLRRCDGAFEAYDYRDGRIITDATPNATWRLEVTAWLPAGPGPFPTVFAAHGIDDSLEGASAHIARELVPEGFAVVAMDALDHGRHPTAAAVSGGNHALAFMGFDLQEMTIDALTLRGNFNQTLVDRLQLIALLRADPDLDGDGAADVDAEHLGYYGVSLGGMMGAPLLALADDVDAGVLTVAGGRLMTFVTDNATVEPFKPLLADLVGSEALLNRLLTAAQTVVDAADPATFGPHVLGDRLDGAPAVPSLLCQVAIADETVPPAAGKALARALNIPHVPPVLDPVALIATSAPAPVAGNLADGAATAGFFQYDRVSAGAGVTAATHNDTMFSAEASLQALHFLRAWRDTGRGEIVDPYAELSTPPLPGE
ncbi:MAG: hypothetical protein CVU56_03420 [Deltaproteobacteria bacterium HGW-Deltaproteobacteria-14]|jgi:dienelactone hydrolase|nr:MAG: hypothetical protein CVU56_03420 [Deltaproteobacteria bacterium HGW-Deltaproteobacteria-14]